MESNSEKEEMRTLVSVSNKLQRDGYTENFMVDVRGMHTMNSKKVYSPDEIRIVNFFRFEGDSDPADNSILYVIETNDGIKGSISDAYGPYADTKITKFMADVEEIMKKTSKTPHPTN